MQRRQGAGDLLDLRDRHRVTVVRSALRGEGAEGQAGTDDDSRQDHADDVLGLAADGGKHDGLLGLSLRVRVIAGYGGKTRQSAPGLHRSWALPANSTGIPANPPMSGFVRHFRLFVAYQ